MSILNIGLMKHPMNWAIIFLMLLIAGIGGALAMRAIGIEYATAQQNPATTLK